MAGLNMDIKVHSEAMMHVLGMHRSAQKALHGHMWLPTFRQKHPHTEHGTAGSWEGCSWPIILLLLSIPLS